VYWSGWKTLSWLLGVQIALYAVYVGYRALRPAYREGLRRDVHASLWLIGFYALVMVVSWLGTFGGTRAVGSPWDSVLVAAIALFAYAWGAGTGVPANRLRLGTDDED
jgi:hypothetical protein